MSSNSFREHYDSSAQKGIRKTTKASTKFGLKEVAKIGVQESAAKIMAQEAVKPGVETLAKSAVSVAGAAATKTANFGAAVGGLAGRGIGAGIAHASGADEYNSAVIKDSGEGVGNIGACAGIGATVGGPAGAAVGAAVGAGFTVLGFGIAKAMDIGMQRNIYAVFVNMSRSEVLVKTYRNNDTLQCKSYDKCSVQPGSSKTIHGATDGTVFYVHVYSSKGVLLTTGHGIELTDNQTYNWGG